MTCIRKLAMAGAACACVLAFSAALTADDRQGTAAAEKDAIRKTAAAYQDALTRGDAREIANHWTDDGTYRDATGRSFNARELIREQFGRQNAAATSARLPVDSSSSIRLVTPKVAIEDGTTQPNAANSPAAAGSYAAIWVKTGQDWRLDSLRESASTSHASRLDPLRWMIGDWVGDGDGFVVTCSTNWTENKKFIVRRFTVQRDGRKALIGTQRIGWDPSINRIRSWGFDSDGGIVEGRWRREGDSWIVKSVGALPDGTRSSAVNFWVPEGEDRCVLQSSHVLAGDLKMEDSTVEFRRRTSS